MTESNELTRALTEQAQINFNRRVQEQNMYGGLINWRSSKVSDNRHKRKVLSGYGKILSLLARGIK